MEQVRIRGGQWVVERSVIAPLTSDGCIPTITARCANMGFTNILSVGHYPIPGVIEYGRYET